MNTASKSLEVFLVFALSPCSFLDDAIRRAKIKTQAIAGDQTYLSHPPHMTLYVSAFENRESAAQSCEKLIAKWQPPALEIVGWHYFQGDVLTGNTTLVCEISEQSRTSLRTYQQALIDEVSGHRSKETSANRYRPHFGNLSQDRQRAVEQFGFPFVGADWIPHLTIASIRPAQWESVWKELVNDPPRGQYHCEKLTIFELINDDPQPWRELPIGLTSLK